MTIYVYYSIWNDNLMVSVGIIKLKSTLNIPCTVFLILLMCSCMYVALMKLNDDDQNALQVIAAILNAILWGLVVVFPFIQVSG